MAFLRMSGLALAAVLGLSLPIGQATAMPANGLAVAVKQVPKRVEDVRLVCGPYRCWSTGWGWHRPFAYWGWRRPLYAYAGPGWGWRRPLYAYAGPGWGWRRPLYAYAGPGWGWRRPLYAYHFTLTPDPVGVGADHSTHLPDPVGVGVGRSMPMPEDPIGAGVDHFTQPQSRPVSASIPGTVVGIPDTPVAARTTPMPA